MLQNAVVSKTGGYIKKEIKMDFNKYVSGQKLILKLFLNDVSSTKKLLRSHNSLNPLNSSVMWFLSPPL